MSHRNITYDASQEQVTLQGDAVTDVDVHAGGIGGFPHHTSVQKVLKVLKKADIATCAIAEVTNSDDKRISSRIVKKCPHYSCSNDKANVLRGLRYWCDQEKLTTGNDPTRIT